MKIGLGIITCQPRDTFSKAFDFYHHRVDDVVVVNDGKEFDHDWSSGFRSLYFAKLPDTELTYIKNDENLGVAKSKNKALKHLYDRGCDYIFLMEDDMYIKDSGIFQAYINASEKSGIEHLMFGYHGPANKNGVSGGTPHPRLIVDYNDFSLAFNQHCVGAFCLYTRESLKDVGFFDENFKNAFDHVSHSYELAMKGYGTPYWWWADLANSTDYIEEQMCSEESSSIKTPDKMKQWENNIRNSMEYFKEKYGYMPFGVDGVPDKTETEIIKFLKRKKNDRR